MRFRIAQKKRAKGRERGTGSRPRQGTRKLAPRSTGLLRKTFRDPPWGSLGAGAGDVPTARSVWELKDRGADRRTAPRVREHPAMPQDHGQLGGHRDRPQCTGRGPRAQEELLKAARAVLEWLDGRQVHQPPEMIDGREWRHRRALRSALAKIPESPTA